MTRKGLGSMQLTLHSVFPPSLQIEIDRMTQARNKLFVDEDDALLIRKSSQEVSSFLE